MKPILLVLVLTAGSAMAQLPVPELNCDDFPIDSACLIQEAAVPFGGSLAADTAGNGGITVKAWDRDTVWVRALIQASASSPAAAWMTAREVSLRISDGRVEADGPARRRGVSWSVTYEIFVPRQADLSLTTLNGGIELDGVRGTLRFTTMNGRLLLRGLAGDVVGSTVNGGVTIALDGAGWDGKGLAAHTMNGAVAITLPAVYSARFELNNVVGGFVTNLPVTAAPAGRLGHSVQFDDGAGGATIRASTINGSLSLKTAE
jgi:DUF4097 and DUF4098 domain-containing protein YvlB